MLKVLSVEIYLLTLSIICVLCYLGDILREHVALFSLFIITTVLLLINLLILLLISKDDLLSISTYLTIVHVLMNNGQFCIVCIL